ncbi:MAG: cytochrome P460 family protein [Geminicoccaceae bacterium]
MHRKRLLVSAMAILAVAGCEQVGDATDAVVDTASTAATTVSNAVTGSCDAARAGNELSGEEALAVYECLKPSLLAGYSAGSKGWIPPERVADYRGWVPVSTVPGAPGFHADRYLFTYVNEIGAAEYLRYAEEGVNMPAGSLIAKETFSVADDGSAKAGPLFFMEKTSAGASPETGDWYYYAVAPNGSPMGINVKTACAECHMENFGARDSLGYPVEEARVGG